MGHSIGLQGVVLVLNGFLSKCLQKRVWEEQVAVGSVCVCCEGWSSTLEAGWYPQIGTVSAALWYPKVSRLSVYLKRGQGIVWSENSHTALCLGMGVCCPGIFSTAVPLGEIVLLVMVSAVLREQLFLFLLISAFSSSLVLLWKQHSMFIPREATVQLAIWE